MNQITDEDRTTPLTVADLKELFVQLAAAFAAAPPLLSPKEGDVVPADQILSLHSETVCEDGRTVLRLYDLADGRIGAQSFQPGEEPGPVRYC